MNVGRMRRRVAQANLLREADEVVDYLSRVARSTRDPITADFARTELIDYLTGRNLEGYFANDGRASGQ